MKVYIMADLEGISGVYARDQVVSDGARFAEGRRYLTRDINICASALKEAGVDTVYARDCHGGSYALLWNELSDDVDMVISGFTGSDRFAFLEGADAVILLGYHAKAGTAGGLLEHTFSSATVQNYFLNGKKVGELEIDASIVGESGVPVIMVSGDTRACEEARDFMPWVETAEVKKSIGCFGAGLLPPDKAERVLRESVKTAVENLKSGKCKPYTTPAPITLTVEVTERTQLPNKYAKPYMKIIDGRTYEVSADSVEEALNRLY